MPPNVLISKKSGEKEMLKVGKKPQQTISQKHYNLINMHLKCVFVSMDLCKGFMCVFLKRCFQSLKQLKSGAAKEGAPHPHHQALGTVSLTKRPLCLGPANLNYPRFILPGKTSPHTTEN